MKTFKYTVEDMHCMMCKNTINKALSQLDGIEDVSFDLDRKEIVVTAHDTLEEHEISDMMKRIGYTPELIQP